jgi:hypothetical protein
MTERRIDKTPKPENEVPVLTLNGKEYPLDSLPADIKNLIEVYGRWQGELKEQRIEVFKLEAAIRGVESEIELRIRQIESTPQV